MKETEWAARAIELSRDNVSALIWALDRIGGNSETIISNEDLTVRELLDTFARNGARIHVEIVK